MTAPRIPALARTLAGAALAVAAITAATAACSDDNGSDGGSGSAAATSRPTSAATSSTQPSGSEPGEVEPHIANLLARYDQVTNQIVADPQVATDDDHPLIQRYLSIVEPGSVAAGAVDTWVDNADQGITIRPYSDDAPAFETSLDGPIETVSADEVRFPTCDRQNYRRYDGQGRQTEFVTGQAVPGEGTAVRIDGEWRLRRLDVASDVVGCQGQEP